MTNSTPSRPHWISAASSMPSAVMMVMMTRKMTPTNVTQNVDSAKLSSPKSKKKYEPVICARLAMTMMSAATMTQPVTQPK